MLRLTRETPLTRVAVRALEAHAELPRREQTRLAELATLGARRRGVGALAGTAGHEQRPKEQANEGEM